MYTIYAIIGQGNHKPRKVAIHCTNSRNRSQELLEALKTDFIVDIEDHIAGFGFIANKE